MIALQVIGPWFNPHLTQPVFLFFVLKTLNMQTDTIANIEDQDEILHTVALILSGPALFTKTNRPSENEM